jgi:hypothetical protein
LRVALPAGLSADQLAAIKTAHAALDEITCTTIHGFCQQLIKPYPVEAGIDPGAAIIDPAAADLAYRDLTQAWLAARFGRKHEDDGLGRIPPINHIESEDDFFSELLVVEPDRAVELIRDAADFLRTKRTGRAVSTTLDTAVLAELSRAIRQFADWYNGCGLAEPTTAGTVADLARLRTLLDEAIRAPVTGRVLARLLLHAPPECRHSSEARFSQWRKLGKWREAAINAGFGKARGEQLSTAGQLLL